MQIPSEFYRRFRWKTSLMAAGTGLILGYFTTILVPPFAPPLLRFAPVLITTIIAVVANQLMMHKYFRGKMRGAFEYIYRESLLDRAITSEIDRARGLDPPVSLELESTALYNNIIARIDDYSDDRQFIAYLAAAHATDAGRKYANEITALRNAVKLKPNDLVANYRLARAFERTGSAQEAVSAYQAALGDTSIDSEGLRSFLASQATRVKEKGPQHGSPIPGLIYQLL